MMTDDQLWEKVYEAYPLHAGDGPRMSPGWEMGELIMIVDDAAMRAHLALNMLWPEIVQKAGGIRVEQPGYGYTAVADTVPDIDEPDMEPSDSYGEAPDPATAIARLWWEVARG